MAHRELLLTMVAETTSGTYQAPAVADGILTGDFSIEYQADEAESQMLSPSFGRTRPSIHVRKQWSFSGITTDFVASGSAGVVPGNHALYLACGMGSTVVAGTSVQYKPTWPPSATTFSVACARSGTRYKAKGVRGSKLEISGEGGATPIMTVDLSGAYIDPDTTDHQTLVSGITYGPMANPFPFDGTGVAAGTVAFHGQQVCVNSFTWMMENSQVFSSDAGCTEAMAHENRNISGTLTIKRPDFGTWNPFQRAQQSVTGSFKLPIGSGAGRVSTIFQPTCQIIIPAEAEVDGLEYIELPWVGIISSSADWPTITHASTIIPA
jgi:hypothetical protein